MYCQSVVFASAQELVLCTEMADYYRCIISLSNSLIGALHHSPGLTSSLQSHSGILLAVASKLKHELLFKECLVHISGIWCVDALQPVQGPTDPVLHKIVNNACNDIYQKIENFEANYLAFGVNYLSHQWFAYTQKLADITLKTIDDKTDEVVLPAYYRALAHAVDMDELPKDLMRLLEPLLKNNLQFSKAGPEAFQSGGSLFSRFLCADIEHDELPWNVGNSKRKRED
jgi:hypothetical protein